jgi:hypothetical protein
MMIETIKKFKTENLYKASRELLEHLGIKTDEITSAPVATNTIFKEPIKQFNNVKDIYIIGSVGDSNFKLLQKKQYEGILVFAVELNTPNPTRKMLADISRAFNREYHFTPVIVIFKYGNKLSLSNTQRQPYKRPTKEGEKVGKVTILRDIEIENPHRGHIDILKQMKLPSNVDSYEAVYNYWQKVFDIEVLQDSFYQQLFEIFEKLIENLEYPENSFNKKAEFVVRLIGRTIFLKFLEKKGVIPQEKFKFKENYYHFVLEPLFFEVLNTPIEKRNSLLLTEIDKLIPFLNGGLFEPHKYDYYGEAFLNVLKVDDNYLEKLLTLLNSYYFTIDENTPLEQEVGLDPELLGMVFENLIGFINPETQESARKLTGSFYTPREIVEYMVSNSLLEHLLNYTNIEKEVLENLIFYSKVENIGFNEKLDILKSLNSIKILDPACGSGAFPMGILNKIVEILNLIDIDAKEWLKLQSKEFQNKHQNKDPDYIRKLSIIQNSIYGVDIQPIAIEIAKLRFFLSLLVDEDKNRIEPLPNLEFKFVCANTLLPLEKIEFPNGQADLFSDENLEAKYKTILKELKEIKKEYFFASLNKGEIKKRFNLKLQQLLKIVEKISIEEAINNKLHSYNPFEVSNSAKFFDNEYMFNLPFEGFDIVIGNPPYIRQEKIKELKTEINRINKKQTAPLYENKNII